MLKFFLFFGVGIDKGDIFDDASSNDPNSRKIAVFDPFHSA